MILFKFKSITNGIRHQIKIKKELLCKTNRILKSSLKGFKSFSGRSSSTGKITVYHRGSGNKKLYRKLSYTKNFLAIVVSILYDPNRSSFLSFNYNIITGFFFLTPHIECVTPGSCILSYENSAELKLGYRLSLAYLPLGAVLSLVSYSKDGNASFIKSAGVYGQLTQKGVASCKIKLPSGCLQSVPLVGYGTLGVISNFFHNKRVIGKAGKARLMGRRPVVRGVAMNPVDHPHGGRTNGGRPSVTPWGKPTKGMKTVKKKNKM